jgi:hypothetical protein
VDSVSQSASNAQHATEVGQLWPTKKHKSRSILKIPK